MTKQFVQIPADGPIVVLTSEGDDYATISAGVGGDIQAVGMPGGYTLYVGEEGKYDGSPFNPRATSITRGILSDRDMVMGDVVICGPVDANGDETTVDLDFVREALHVAVPA